MDNEQKKELFSERVPAGSRNYFFDVKESSNGDKYLVISESKKTEAEFLHHRIMIFEDHLIGFSEGFKKALNFLNIAKKAYSQEQVRKVWKKAYMPWTKEDDEMLKEKYRNDTDVEKLAVIFQRKPGAIKSRLMKLGLIVNEEDR